jgi:hypothetical protein
VTFFRNVYSGQKITADPSGRIGLELKEGGDLGVNLVNRAWVVAVEPIKNRGQPFCTPMRVVNPSLPDRDRSMRKEADSYW